MHFVFLKDYFGWAKMALPKLIEEEYEVKGQWKAAAYLRLSHDDGQYSESMSITNQKSLILEWASKQTDIDIVDIYIDDGFSGTNFDRPAYRNMMFDIKIGRIDCVIVKDLSRLGRNLTKVGELIDEFFPENRVRFVDINDNMDTLGLIDENDITGFKLVCNEFYVKDTSKKVRSALRASAKRGNYVGALAPYGYKKSKEDYHKLVIDTEAAVIVKTIFLAYSEGHSGREIADSLNSKMIPCPYNYRNRLLGKEFDNSKHWTSTTVLEILHNEVYFGNPVQHKREKLSYKLKQRRITSKEEQIVSYGTHEAIVDENLEQLVKERFSKRYAPNNRKRNNGNKVPVLFSGMLRCYDCGSKMPATIKNEKRCYRCYKYNNSGKSACTSHFIYEKDLLDYVLFDIKRIIFEYGNDREEFINYLIEHINDNNSIIVSDAKNYREISKTKIKEIEDNMIALYNDKKNGCISQSMFSLLSKKYDDELTILLQECNNYDNIIKNYEVNEAVVLQWIRKLLELNGKTNPTAEQLHSIIDEIYIKSTGSDNRIVIRYKIGFLDIEKICNQLKIA